MHRPLLLAAVLLATSPSGYAQESYQTPPPALARLVEAPPTPNVSIGPDGQALLLMRPEELPTIQDLARPELRLGGLRLDPQTNARSRTRAYTDLTFRTLDGLDDRPVTGLPEGAKIGEVRWAPDGRHAAFTLTLDDRVELWAAAAATGAARRLLDRPLNAIAGPTFQWLPSGDALVAQTISPGREPAPEAPPAPPGPVTQESTGQKAPARTYQDLLQDEHDEALFEHYLQTQIARVGLDGSVRDLGAPGLVTSIDPSPDGRYVLVQERLRPFSYLVPYYRFPNRIAVIDADDGALVHEVARLPLIEGVPIARGATTPGVRSAAWRADAPATLVWVEAQDGGDPSVDVEVRDRVFMHPAPFAGEPAELAALAYRYGGVDWSNDDLALVTEYWPETRHVRTYAVAPADPSQRRLLFDYSYEDRYNDPGDPMTRTDANGQRVLVTTADGGGLYLSGQGASPEGNRPYVATLDLATGEREELFRSEAPYYETPVGFADAGAERPHRLVTRRESVTEPPNYFLRDLAADAVQPLTDFEHPYPELRDVQKELITYARADGVPLSATLYLPPGYDAARDGPLPTLVWAYPREFKSAANAGQLADSPYRFARVSYWGAVPYVTQGFAVIDNAAMPVIGEGDVEPNDSFVDQLVSSAQAAIDEGARRGVVDPERVAVGGHSYGAFMTANLLAHSDLFRAGVARSGAYNRTLTPFGFQNEARTFWEAPEIYFAMSPFMHADDVDEPILLIHGAADNNSGTFPMQSERFYNAIKGHGGTARLVMLPYESHGYRARESLLHMLYETNRWLDAHVKDAAPRTPTPTIEEATGR